MSFEVFLSVLIIALFFVIYLVIGHYSAKAGTKTFDDYILAGRGFGQFVGFFIVSATWISVVFYLGGPGWFYTHGLAFAFVPAYALTFGLTWWFFGKKVSELGHEKGYYTQAQFIGDFYQSDGARILALIVGLAAILPYVQTQFLALGYIAHAATGELLPVWTGSFIAFVVVVIYVCIGGFRATAWTNVLQGFLMFIGLFVIAGIVLYHYFDFSIAKMFAVAATDLPAHLTLPGGVNFMTPSMWGSFIILYGICGGIWFPHLWVRAYSIKSPKFFHHYPKYILGLYIVIVPLIIIIGLGGRIALAGVTLESTDQILPALLNATVALPIAAILLSGAIGGSMSTVDGLTHSVGSMFTNDFIKRYWTISESQSIMAVRVIIFVVALAGLILGYTLPGALFALAATASSFAGVLAPSCAGALFKWQKATKWGCMASLICGTVIAWIFQFNFPHPMNIHGGIWAFAVAIGVYVVVSLATSASSGLNVQQVGKEEPENV